jgi:hypothetical protein
MRAVVVLFVPALVALAGCGDGDDAAGTVTSVITPDQPPTTSVRPAAPATPRTDPALAPAPTAARTDLAGPPPTVPPGGSDVDRAIADVVARTGVDAAAVTLIAQDDVTWRDSSIGCPQEGMEYLQVLTEGTRVIVEADGQRFEYHRGGRRDLFYCASPHPPVGE